MSSAASSSSSGQKPSSSRSRRDKDDTNNPDLVLPSIGNYIFQKTVGEGNFAKVKLAIHKLTNAEVAIKVIDKTQLDEKKLSKLYREVRIMKLLHHPNIVKLYEVIETKHTVFLVMEYASGGELYDYLVVHGKMKEKEARAKFRQILSAVSYCHKKRVIHRDLKAENLLLDANLDIKIADFGFSNLFDPDLKLDTFCGSPPYAAPELFQGRRYTGPEVDIWSLGVILYVLTTGCLPFDGKNLQEMRESVCRGKYRIPFYLSDSCEKLLRKFLVRDPSKRGSLDMLVDDPWINESYGDSPISTDVSQRVEEDESIIKIIEAKFKVDRDTVIQSIRENVYNDIAAVYYLMYYEKDTRASVAADANVPDITQMSSPTRQKEPSTTPTKANPAMMRIDEDGVLPASENPAPAQQPKPTTTTSRRRRATVGGADNDAKASDNEIDSNDQLKKGANAHKDAPTANPASLNLASGNAGYVPGSALNNGKESTGHTHDARPTTAAAAIPVPHGHITFSSATNSSSGAGGSDASAHNADGGAEGDASLFGSGAQVGQGTSNNNRKRHNTIVGILRGQMKRAADGVNGGSPALPGSADGTGAVSSDPNGNVEDSNSAIRTGEDANKPRSLRFTFNSNTTSSKPPDEITQEVIKVCNKNGITYRLPSRYLLECQWVTPANSGPGKEAVKFEVEICKLPRLNNLHGLRFKRVGGSSADYKEICEKILSSVAL